MSTNQPCSKQHIPTKQLRIQRNNCASDTASPTIVTTHSCVHTPNLCLSMLRGASEKRYRAVVVGCKDLQWRLRIVFLPSLKPSFCKAKSQDRDGTQGTQKQHALMHPKNHAELCILHSSFATNQDSSSPWESRVWVPPVHIYTSRKVCFHYHATSGDPHHLHELFIRSRRL